ncbi:hypothetical protein [Bdellovibrio sp. HCB274]|uniref:hypothetical protein n=1 Tax=Bdellovibrio sp. HCB274 TaxID=3394361 RepID=UPI0039B3A4DF
MNELHLESIRNYLAARKKHGNRRRPRIPTLVARRIIDLLEDCKGNKLQASRVSAIMRPENELDLMVRNINKNMRNRAIKPLKVELSKNIKMLNERGLSLGRKREVKKEVTKLRREIKRLSTFEVRWNPFNVSREMDANYQWIRTMKAHLKRSIMAEGRPKIK